MLIVTGTTRRTVPVALAGTVTVMGLLVIRLEVEVALPVSTHLTLPAPVSALPTVTVVAEEPVPLFVIVKEAVSPSKSE